MYITRKSPLTGKIQTRDLDVTVEQLTAWKQGALAQRAFPNLSPGNREFIMSGYTEEDWEVIFPPEDEEEENNPSIDF